MNKSILAAILVTLILCVSPAGAEWLSVTAEKANVRSGPGNEHEILWSVGQYYPVEVTNKSESWYQIKDFEGDVGWIHASLLKNVPAVVIKNAVVNVREGPGTNFKVVFQAEKGVGLKLLGKEKNWLKVKHADGEEGWIEKSLVWGY